MFAPLLKSIALSTLLTCSAIAVADQSDYKLMVIKDQQTSEAILAGQYETALTNQFVQTVTAERNYELAFNRCAANVKLNKYVDAEELCTQAISLLKESNVPGYKRRELTAYALSNRGIARILSSNDTAGLSDFYEAVKVSDNELVHFNLNRAKQNLAL